MEQYNEVLELFEEIKSRYEFLTDTDVLEAFSLMRDSSSLLANYDTLVADAYKLSSF